MELEVTVEHIRDAYILRSVLSALWRLSAQGHHVGRNAKTWLTGQIYKLHNKTGFQMPVRRWQSALTHRDNRTRVEVDSPWYMTMESPNLDGGRQISVDEYHGHTQ